MNNAADPDGDPLTYTFELYADAGLTTLVAAVNNIAQTPSTTAWTAPVTLSDNTHYWWRARASDPYDTGPWMTPASFFVNTVNDPPTVPTLSSPPDGAEVTTLQPVLEVNNSSDLDGDRLTYQFELYSDPNLTVPVASVTDLPEGVGTTRWPLPVALQENSAYWWRARAVDEHGVAGDWVAAAAFFVNTANDPPTAPAIVSPVDQSEVTILQPSLTVSNATDPDRNLLIYEFELDVTASFNSPALIQSGPQLEGTSQTTWPAPQPLADNTHYYWRARANDGQAVSGWSTATFFVNTVNDPPTAPTLANPPNGSQVASLTPTLSVNNSTDPDGDALTYRFEIYADPFLLLLVTASPEVTQGTGQTSWTVTPALQENHLYWWRVRAKDSHNLAGGWMTTAAFQVNVQNDPPTAPIPLWPILGVSVFTATPTLLWVDGLDPEGAALTYQVQVYSDNKLTNLVASINNLPGTSLTTSWQVTPALTVKTTYYWRVRGSDGQLYSAWSATQTFKVTKLALSDHLQFAATKPAGLAGQRVATIGGLSGLTGSPTEAIFYYHTDHLGTPIMMTDSTGQVVWKAEYLPFGEVASLNEDVDGDGIKVTNNLRFPGQYGDAETGLHYNMARDYQPVVGRYIQSDPIGLWGGLNTYSYATSNPCRRFDPLGLWSGADAALSSHFYTGWGAPMDISAWCPDYLADSAVQGQTANLHNKIDDQVKSLVGLQGETTFSVTQNDPLVITNIYSFGRGNTRILRADCDAEGDGCCVSAKCKLRYFAADRFSDPVRLCDKLGICGDPIRGVQNLGGTTFWFQLSCSGAYGSSACGK